MIELMIALGCAMVSRGERNGALVASDADGRP
jgi:hypothetical protein